MSIPKFLKLQFESFSNEEMINRSLAYLSNIEQRRTVRNYSSKEIDNQVIINCLASALTAPSGANQQPWHFVVVTDKLIKSEIRVKAEEEEHEFYTKRATPEWLKAIAQLGTDENKEFLEVAPFLIVVFAESYKIDNNGNHIKNYYVQESVGISVGFLIAALHNSGIATLTHTPSPMNFLNTILNRPNNERPYLILVCGIPEKNALVPDIQKNSINDSVSFI